MRKLSRLSWVRVRRSDLRRLVPGGFLDVARRVPARLSLAVMSIPPELGTSFSADLTELTKRGKDDGRRVAYPLLYREGGGLPK